MPKLILFSAFTVHRVKKCENTVSRKCEYGVLEITSYTKVSSHESKTSDLTRLLYHADNWRELKISVYIIEICSYVLVFFVPNTSSKYVPLEIITSDINHEIMAFDFPKYWFRLTDDLKTLS